ncbi:MAG: hypothetical protein ABJJ05_03300 [Maribacter litoralis]|uniref:hypothetical protein n=1 Tax=Maribacter litoralis TaxID=2059726 RepID=UPI003296E0E8
MDIKHFISFRKKLQDFETTSFGFKGLFILKDSTDKELIRKFSDSQIREIYYQENQNTADHKNLIIGEKVIVLIDLSKFDYYYEDFKEFLGSNKYGLKNEDFYIFDLDYHHNLSEENRKITNFLKIQSIISFLKKLSTYEKETKGLLELFFNKPDKICSIIFDYDEKEIINLSLIKSITNLNQHVFETSDKETRIRLFTNEMMNILSSKDFQFKTVLENWDLINSSYRNSFQIYLSEFSFEKIKTSSQEYFHELTDRIYSTINKFSAYILAIPVAYILILRFFDFDGENFAKDSFLAVIGLLYFIVIWFVLLNNLSKAFEAIENDISNFIKRIRNEENLAEITESLENQKTKLIPNQKRKIILVRIVSIIILIMTIGAYLMIYLDKICVLLSESLVANTI